MICVSKNVACAGKFTSALTDASSPKFWVSSRARPTAPPTPGSTAYTVSKPTSDRPHQVKCNAAETKGTKREAFSICNRAPRLNQKAWRESTSGKSGSFWEKWICIPKFTSGTT